MIVDGHAHIFPFLGSAAGFPAVADHLRVLQLYLVGHGQPVRRLADHALVDEPGLAELPLDGPERLHDVAFRVEDNGRFVWRSAGEDRYIHFMPPSLQANACSAELLLAEMAYAGVDVAVLQNAHLYGRLSEYFAAAVARYPGKFIGLAEVDEPNADQETEQRDLRVAVRELGLKGLYYANRGFFFDGYRTYFDHPRYEAFWELVRALGIPVFWELVGVPVPTPENFLLAIERLNRWAARYPTIPSVLTHGVGPEFLTGNLPEPLVALFRNEQFLVEILYPIHWGRNHEYPYAELQPVLATLYRHLGGERLIWGSDMPNVQRNCTYRQSLDYFRLHSDFLPSRDRERILSGNLLQLFNLAFKPCLGYQSRSDWYPSHGLRCYTPRT
jgi:predicted TIM-barrel fold metal-dependent hydrolase